MTDHKYRKKPLVIEAVQWDGRNEQEVMAFIDADDRWMEGVDDGGYVDGPGIGITPAIGTLDIPTLDGVMTAQAGDWICRGIKGELYPCKPDIFEATYEKEASSEREELRLRVAEVEVRADAGEPGETLTVDEYRRRQRRRRLKARREKGASDQIMEAAAEAKCLFSKVHHLCTYSSGGYLKHPECVLAAIRPLVEAQERARIVARLRSAPSLVVTASFPIGNLGLDASHTRAVVTLAGSYFAEALEAETPDEDRRA